MGEADPDFADPAAEARLIAGRVGAEVALVRLTLLTRRDAAHDCVGSAEGTAALPRTAPVAGSFTGHG